MMDKRKIIGYVEIHDNCCEYCKYRKELYPQSVLPEACKECGFLGQRDLSYVTKLPVYEEEQK